MYRVEAETTFSALHQLRGYFGSTERMHGHDWRVTIRLEGRELSKEGYLVDFVALERWLAALANHYEHEVLNELPPFDRLNPTAEHLARVVAEQLDEAFGGEGVRVHSVRVEEAPGCFAEYLPE